MPADIVVISSLNDSYPSDLKYDQIEWVTADIMDIITRTNLNVGNLHASVTISKNPIAEQITEIEGTRRRNQNTILFICNI
ncbi:MAG: hypothetical protein WC666_00855 [Candidatus Paceibacterota bacterium]|jgi:hypothetical protein